MDTFLGKYDNEPKYQDVDTHPSPWSHGNVTPIWHTSDTHLVHQIPTTNKLTYTHSFVTPVADAGDDKKFKAELTCGETLQVQFPELFCIVSELALKTEFAIVARSHMLVYRKNMDAVIWRSGLLVITKN